MFIARHHPTIPLRQERHVKLNMPRYIALLRSAELY
jgi:hypothetical protein